MTLWRFHLARVANAGLVVFGLALLVVLGTGGTRLVLGEFSVGLHRVWPPLQILAFFAALRLIASKRSSGLEGMLVTFFARQGLPPRDGDARAYSAARAGTLLGVGAGLVIAASDVTRVILSAGKPGPGLGEALGVSSFAAALGLLAGASVGALGGLAVYGAARALGVRPGGYEAGRYTVALLLLVTPLVVTLAPQLGSESHTPRALLGVAMTTLASAAVIFVLIPAVVLRAMEGRWGVALGSGVVLAFALGLAALALLGGSSYESTTRGSSYPNVLVVSVSGLRPEFVGAYTQGRSLTPGIDALAARGALMRLPITPSTALSPAVASWLTGTYPTTHRVREQGDRLAFTSEGLPVLLASHGYQTAAFVSSRALGGRETRFAEMFSSYDDLTTWSDWVSRLALSRLTGPALRPDEDEIRPAAETVASFRDWLAGLPEGPWFAWVQLAEPLRPRPVALEGPAPPAWVSELFGEDTPLAAPPRWASEAERARPRSEWIMGYLASVITVDSAVGSLVAALAARGEHTRTVLVVVSEQGVSLGEDNLWFSPGSSLSDDIVHVPWLLYGPGVAAGRAVDGPCSLVDVFPTVLGLLGMSTPRRVEGEDLSRYLSSQSDFERPPHAGPVFSEVGAAPASTKGRAVRLGIWKLIREADGLERLILVDPRFEAEVRDPRGSQERMRQQLSDILTDQRAREVAP